MAEATHLSTQEILERLYPKLGQRQRRRKAFPAAVVRWLRRNGWPLGIGFVLILAWIGAHLFFYNTLVDMQFNIQEAWAQVEAQLERRYNIQHNLILVTVEYAKHERELNLRLTELRMRQERGAGTPGSGAGGGTPGSGAGGAGVAPGSGAGGNPAPAGKGGQHGGGAGLLGQLKASLGKLTPGQLNELVPRIQVLAESYPSLRLSENFQQFSKAVVDNENQIVKAIAFYNKQVNLYTTLLKQFPGNVFGPVCGFKISDYDFYKPERKTLPFEKVIYRLDGAR